MRSREGRLVVYLKRMIEVRIDPARHMMLIKDGSRWVGAEHPCIRALHNDKVVAVKYKDEE